MKSIPFLMMSLFVLLPAGQALAGGHGDGAAIVDHIFETADRDRDGVLSKAEFDEAGLADFGMGFEACDGDSNGELTSEEYLDVYRRHHPPQGELAV